MSLSWLELMYNWKQNASLDSLKVEVLYASEINMGVTKPTER